MRKTAKLVALLAVLSFVGCNSPDSAKKQSAATAGEANASVPAATGAGAITPDNTTIAWVGTKKDGKHNGGFKGIAGSLKSASSDLAASTLSVDIDTTSLFSDNPRLTNHLKSPDFFDVKTYPKATFVSTSIKAEPQGEATHVINGDLTLHGTTKPVSLPVKATATDEQVTLDGTFTIDRTAFGIAYSPEQVDKEVKITVSARIPRK